MKKRMILIDASGLLFRAYFAMMKNPLRNKDGIPTSAIYGFFRMIFNVLKKYPCHAVAAAFDVPRASLERTKQYSDYKAHRKDVPDDLIQQIPLAKECLELTGIPALTIAGHEADDVLASLVKKYEDDYEILVFTGDKDLLQLVHKDVKVVLPDKTGDKILDREGVKELKGVYPEQIADFLAILGDTSDNIPGIKGIGEKGAVTLLEEWGNLKNIYNNLENIKPALSKKLIESTENAWLSLSLAELKSDLDVTLPNIYDVPIVLNDLATPEFSQKIQELELFSLLKEMSPSMSAKTKTTESQGLFATEEVPAEEFGLTTLDRLNGSLFIGMYIIDDNVQFSTSKDSYNLPIVKISEYQDLLQKFFDGQSEDGVSFIVFDQKKLIHVFAKQGVILPKVDDLKIMAYLLDPTRTKYSPEYLALSYLGINTSSGKIFLDLKNKLYELLLKEGSDKIYHEIEMPLRPILAYIENKGVRVHADLLDSLSQSFEEELKRLSENIYHLAGKEFNILSPKQLGQILFEDLGLKPFKKTKTKSYSTDSETMEALAEVHPLPKEIIEYRTLSKLKSTYTDALLKAKDEHDRVHTTLHQTVTATGRLSSEDPNLQNIPIRTEMGQKIRTAFIPSDNKILVSADYSQIELRLFAILSKDTTMKSFFSHGGDVHRHTAAEMFQLPESQITSEQRRAAKTINYGISYGMSVFRLSNELNIDYGQAKEFIDNYFITFPGVKEFMGDTLEFARTHGYVQTMYGRRRPTPELYGKACDKITNLSHASRFAINAVVQGSAADIIKKAMIAVQQMIDTQFSESVAMILQVHDELLFEVDPTVLDKFKQCLIQVMESVIELEVPLEVEIGYGQNWGEAH